MSHKSHHQHEGDTHPHAKPSETSPAGEVPPGEALAGAGGAPTPADEIDRLKQEVKQAKEQYLRTLAEVDNTKKRLQREKEEFIKYAAETFVRGLLPIMDSLDQALVAVDPPAPQGGGEGSGTVPGPCKLVDIQAVVKGVQLIRQQLLGVLEKEGVKRIATIGEPFDPHRHEAVAQADAAGNGQADDTVVEEVQVGYTMHGKVIRPAMVKVARNAATSDTQQPTTQDTTNTEDHSTESEGGSNGKGHRN